MRGGSPALRAILALTLEEDLRCNLNIPRQVRLARDLAEVRVRRVGLRVAEHRMIERIEELDVELGTQAVGESPRGSELGSGNRVRLSKVCSSADGRRPTPNADAEPRARSLMYPPTR